MPSTCCLRRLRRMGVRVVYTSRITACPHIADGVSRGWGQKKEFNDNRELGTGDGGRPRRTGARPRAEFKWMAPGFPRVGRAAPLSYLCVYNVVYLRLCCSQERRSASRQQSSEIRSRASTSPRPAKLATSFPRAGVVCRRGGFAAK